MNSALQPRWPQGYKSAWRGQGKAWPLRTALRQSAGDHQSSVKAATILEDAYKARKLWFRGLWFCVVSCMIGGLLSCGGGAGSAAEAGGETVPNPHSVDLSWNASTSPVVGYNVYRSTSSNGPYEKLNASLVSATTYTDQTVEGGVTYYYVTTAVDSEGLESAYSNQAVAVIPD